MKKNLSLVAKTLCFQVVISLLGLMLGTATGAYTALRLIGAAFAVLAYFYILGGLFWKQGAQDAVKDTLPRALPLKGLWLSLLAFLPSIVGVLLCALLPMADAAGAQNWVFALFAVVKLLFMGVYFGFAAVLYPTGLESTPQQVLAASKGQSLVFALCLLPGILVCAVCYVLGYKNNDLFGLFADQRK